MKRMMSITILVFLLVVFQRITFGAEVTGVLSLGYSYASMSGDICNNMGSAKTGSGFYYATMVKDDKFAFIIAESDLTFKGTDSISVDIVDGPQAGYEFNTSLSLKNVNVSGGMVLFKYFIPHIGINYYYGEKSYERMEAAPYYWEKRTEKVSFALGLNEGLLIYIPFSQSLSLSIIGSYNQKFLISSLTAILLRLRRYLIWVPPIDFFDITIRRSYRLICYSRKRLDESHCLMINSGFLLF